MGVVGRLDQYASMLAYEFDETTANNPSITGLGTYYASEFNENIVDIVRNGLVLNLDAGNLASYSGSGTTWTDLSGNSNNATLVNGPTYSSENGGSIVFDGTNDYVLVNSSASIPYGSTARTVSIWFYTNTITWANDVNNLFYYGAGSNGASFGIDFSTYPSMEVYTWGGAGRDLTFSTTYSQVGWKNITVTYNGSTTILIYENGIFTQTLTLTSACNTTSSSVYIGAINPSVVAGGYYDGRIATTQIYNRALTTTEVTQNYNALATRFGLSAPIPLTANVFAPYDLVYDEFGGTLFGAGQGRYMRQNTDKSVIVYNEIDEITDLFGRGIVRGGLVLDLDAGISASYSGSGTTWTDLSASGNNGTLVSSPTYSSTNGGSFTFNGSNQYATLGTPSSLNITGSITINSWVKFSSLPSSGNFSTIYEKGYDNINEQTFLRYNGSSGCIEFGTYNQTNFTTYYTPYVVGSSVLVNNWCNIIGIFDGFSFRIYLNNVLVSQTAYTGTLLSSSAPVSIGAASISGSYQRFLSGNISSVQAYNRALSAAEVSQNFNALKGRFGL